MTEITPKYSLRHPEEIEQEKEFLKQMSILEITELEKGQRYIMCQYGVLTFPHLIKKDVETLVIYKGIVKETNNKYHKLKQLNGSQVWMFKEDERKDNVVFYYYTEPAKIFNYDCLGSYCDIV